MAKQRYINTHFWDDAYIELLKPMERYLFIYFLTNPHTNICGIYELSLKRMTSEAGLPESKIKATLDKFSEGGKIYYISGWVYVKNFIRHQSVNPKIVQGIDNKMKEVPSQILKKIKEITPIDSLYIENELSEPELEPELEPRPNSLREVDDSFDQFWSLYRKKVARDKAKVAWKKVKPSEHEAIFTDIRRKNTSESWTKSNGDYIPNPTTYINQRRWEDQVDAPSTAAPPKRICPECKQEKHSWVGSLGVCTDCFGKTKPNPKYQNLKSELFKSNLTPKPK